MKQVTFMQFVSEIIRRETFVIEYGSHVRDSIIILLDGQFSCAVDGFSFTAKAGDICVFRRDSLFERKVLLPLRCVYLQFEEFPIPLRSGLLRSDDPARTKNTIAHLTCAVEEQNQTLMEHFIWDILLLHRSPQAQPSPTDPIVSACIQYFNTHLSENITLDMLAERFSISKQWLIRKFKHRTHRTPMDYLFITRINHGKLLLRDSGLSVGDIAQRCGFDNVYYFSNCFKRATGLSPTAYSSLLDL
jgi:AraC-like DNA-binding protein